MKLIRNLGTRLNKNGFLVSYGEFLCPFDNKIVERSLSGGKRYKSCGCQQYSDERNKKLSNSKKGLKHTEESKQKISKTRIENGTAKGKNNSNWKNGSSFEPYSPKFNKELKQFILERDNYACQCPNCKNLSKRLNVHHIDFNKQNNIPENLIILCSVCHTKTNFKRTYWLNFYCEIMLGRVL